MDHQHVFRQAGISWEVLTTLVSLFLQIGQGGKRQVMWCLRRHQIIHDVGSLCIYTMWLFNFFLAERTLMQELQGKETRGKRDQGKFGHHALFHHQAVLSILPIPPLPPYFSSTSASLFFSSSSSSFSFPLGGLKGLQALQALLQGPVGQALGWLHTGMASYKIVTGITRLWFSYSRT